MKLLKLIPFLIATFFFACHQKNTSEVTNTSKTSETIEQQEIKTLIRQVLYWADTNRFDLLPALEDEEEETYIGFDLNQHKKNLKQMEKTNFFTAAFIENYNQIIETLDKGLRDDKNEKWLVGDLPTFSFANGANPWCNCQDNLDWNTVDVKILSIDNQKADLEWFWNNANSSDESWSNFRYHFRAVKENNQWKIDYMEGFDLKESTQFL